MLTEQADTEIPQFTPVVDAETERVITQFLYFEARLLDERRFHEWLGVFSDDIRYWMPIRYNRLRREMATETSGPAEPANFDEDKASLTQRIKRLDTGMAWAEDPPSRTRHLVTNVAVLGEADGEYDVESYFLCYRSRGDREVDIWAGKRDDRLRRTPSGKYLIARRTILLDQATLLSKNLSVFF